jgi:hypothetical protein
LVLATLESCPFSRKCAGTSRYGRAGLVDQDALAVGLPVVPNVSGPGLRLSDPKGADPSEIGPSEPSA